MRAIVQDRYGEADDVLRLEEVETPQFADDEVLLRVHAAGVDRGVWHLMTGLPYPVRLAGYGLRAPKGRVRGLEVAGVVVAVGRNVKRLQQGDEVFGIADGSFAEYARAKEETLAPKPGNVSFAEAACVPVSGSTALQAVRDHGRVRAGQRVLLIGASGGVGSFAVQIAKWLGAEVTGVCSAAKAALVLSLGADHVIDYERASIGDAGRRYDVIVDAAGHRSLSELRRALSHDGTLVVVGSETGGRWLGGNDRQLRAMLVSPFVDQSLLSFISTQSYKDLALLKELIESGVVTPAVDRTYPLDEAPAAIRYMVDGHVRGKVAVTA